MSETIEARLAKVERELAILKTRTSENGTKGNWVEKITGSFQDDPDFDEIVRLGHEFRQSDRPQDDE